LIARGLHVLVELDCRRWTARRPDVAAGLCAPAVVGAGSVLAMAGPG